MSSLATKSQLNVTPVPPDEEPVFVSSSSAMALLAYAIAWADKVPGSAASACDPVQFQRVRIIANNIS